MACFSAFFYWLSQNILAIQSGTPDFQARLLAQTKASTIYLTASTAPLRIIKVSKDASLSRQEYQLHKEIELAFLTVAEVFGKNKLELSLPCVPRCFAFYPKIRNSEYGEMFRGLEGQPENGCGIAMGYIRPFSQGHIQTLLKRHISRIPPPCASGYEHFLVKIYMGDTKPLSYGSTTDLYNCAAYTDHLHSERVDPQSISATMGNTLAILHWRCGVDAAGVKFVFGRNEKGNIKLWLIDFSECRNIRLSITDDIIRLVGAILHNAPCWPIYSDLPESRIIWKTFKMAYLKTSELLLKDVSSDSRLRLLPLLFMDELERIQGPRGLFG